MSEFWNEESIILGIQMYFQMVASFVGGGRWIANAINHVNRVNNVDRVDHVEDNNTTTHKYDPWLGRAVMVEELCENIGGIIMSFIVIASGDSNNWIAIFSIIMTAISLLYKTATYIAILDNWKVQVLEGTLEEGFSDNA